MPPRDRTRQLRPHSRRSDLRPAAAEPLERRALLSTVALPAGWTASPIAIFTQPHSPGSTSGASPASATYQFGYAPTDVRTAYGLGAAGASTVTFNGVQADGAGQTIAIVDAYHDPTAASDLAAFDAQFGLPTPYLAVHDQLGGNSLPTAVNATWQEEEALDLEWAHAMAPGAALVLYEANTNASADLFAAVQAAATGLASVVSMSWAGGEFPTESASDGLFDHAGTTFLASSGDGGAGALYPAASPNVIAVGGTTLPHPGPYYGGESAWSGSGGGASAYEPQPAYQSGVVPAAMSNGMRTVPDVALVADPGTGVAVYDGYTAPGASPTGPWWVVGGTSLACPAWAGLAAVVNQGRVARGLRAMNAPDVTFNGATFVITDHPTNAAALLYGLPQDAFHDVATGGNGHPAVAGYDLVTGRGTPLAGAVVSALTGQGTVVGRLYGDGNNDGRADGTDGPLPDVDVYLDLNNNNAYDAGEPFATTSGTGTFDLDGLPTSESGSVRVLADSSFASGLVLLPYAAAVTTAATGAVAVDVPAFPTDFSYLGSTNVAWDFRLDPTATRFQVLANGAPAYSVPVAWVAGVDFDAYAAGSSVTVDGVNGNPVPVGGFTVAAQGKPLPLAVVGSPGADAFNVAATTVRFGGRTVTFANVSALSLDPGGGDDAIALAAGAPPVAVPVPATNAAVLVRELSALTLAGGTKLALATAAATTGRQLLLMDAAPVVTGTLDLGGNDMLVRNGSLAALTQLAAAGFDAGRWDGTGGLASAAAAANAGHLTGLGVAANRAGTGAMFASFDGVAASATDVLVRYTYYGDANLDGAVSAADYTRVDGGFITGATGWANGDFNYDRAVDGSDYTLVDNAFNRQSATLAPAAVLAAAPAPTAPVAPDPSSAGVATATVPIPSVAHDDRRRARRLTDGIEALA